MIWRRSSRGERQRRGGSPRGQGVPQTRRASAHQARRPHEGVCLPAASRAAFEASFLSASTSVGLEVRRRIMHALALPRTRGLLVSRPRRRPSPADQYGRERPLPALHALEILHLGVSACATVLRGPRSRAHPRHAALAPPEALIGDVHSRQPSAPPPGYHTALKKGPGGQAGLPGQPGRPGPRSSATKSVVGRELERVCGGT
ncbi:hypothetical protein CRUP_016990 [Coryphaenoides rupestris]|nr:hypothetical protein CRUP_016990 [Coryphaenoides rupestris]